MEEKTGRYQIVNCGNIYAIILDTWTGKVKRVKVEFEK